MTTPVLRSREPQDVRNKRLEFCTCGVRAWNCDNGENFTVTRLDGAPAARQTGKIWSAARRSRLNSVAPCLHFLFRPACTATRKHGKKCIGSNLKPGQTDIVTVGSDIPHWNNCRAKGQLQFFIDKRLHGSKRR